MKITLEHCAAFSRAHGIFLVLLALIMFEIGVNYSEKSAPPKPVQKTNKVTLTQEVARIQTYVPVSAPFIIPEAEVPESGIHTNSGRQIQKTANPATMPPSSKGNYPAQSVMRTSQETRKKSVTYSRPVPPNAIRVAVP